MGYSYREYAEVFSIEKENNTFEAKLLDGNYSIEVWAWDSEKKTTYHKLLLIKMVKPGFLKLLVLNPRLRMLILHSKEYVITGLAPVESRIVNSNGEQLEEEIWSAYLDLTPLDDNDTPLSDFPVYSIYIEPDGSINWDAPVGKFKLDLVSYGNPMELEDDNITWNISDSENEFPALKVKTIKLLEVSGSLKDESNNSVWGVEIAFVNPDDEDDVYYPQWVPNDNYDMMLGWIEPEVSTYEVLVPEGTYKIRANVYSNLHENTYYGGTNFEDAAEIIIMEDTDLSNLDIVFKEASLPTLDIRIVDENSEPVLGAWFNFYDGEYEFGGMDFPEIEEGENGLYTLKIRPGVFKILVEAPGYESF